MIEDQYWVACDLDNVVLDFYGGVRHAVETEYNVIVPPFSTWDMHEVLDPIIGKSWWKWMRERDWLWPNFPAVPGAIGGLAQLRDAGYYVEIVTSKPEWAEFSVWKWLGKWRPPANRVTIVNMDIRKVDATDADVLIDDKLKNVVDFADDDRYGVLFSAESNLHESELPNGVVRAKDWHAAVDLVRLSERGDL